MGSKTGVRRATLAALGILIMRCAVAMVLFLTMFRVTASISVAVTNGEDDSKSMRATGLQARCTLIQHPRLKYLFRSFQQWKRPRCLTFG